MVDEARGILGPIEFRDTFQVRLRRSAQRWRSPDADVVGIRGAGLANPEGHEGIIGRETESSNGRIDEFWDAALRQVVECSGTDLHDPNIRFAVLVGEKRDEMAVVREGGGKSFALEFGDGLKFGAGDRAFPEALGFVEPEDQGNCEC